MISPYQVAAPQGNVLGAIMDFIGQSRALQLDAGTRNQLNAQEGYGDKVDPFQMQKFAGEGQRQTIAGDMNRRAETEQSWQGADRNSQAEVLKNLSGNPALSQDPVLSSLLGGGANPMLGQAVTQMLQGDRNSLQERSNYGVEYGYRAAQDQVRHQQQLAEIQAQMVPKAPTYQELMQQRKDDAVARGAGGDRSGILALQAMGYPMDYNAARQIGLDDGYNRAEATKAKNESEGAAAIKAQMEKNKTNPKQTSQQMSHEEYRRILALETLQSIL